MLDIDEIKKLIPHRYPFLLIDKVVEFKAGKSIKGIKNVTVNEPFFQGHFPDFPVMPGVLIIEAMAQLTAILGILEIDESERSEHIPLFAGINNVKFRKQVRPGDCLSINVDVLKKKRSLTVANAVAAINDGVAAEAQIKAVLQKGKQV